MQYAVMHSGSKHHEYDECVVSCSHTSSTRHTIDDDDTLHMLVSVEWLSHINTKIDTNNNGISRS